MKKTLVYCGALAALAFGACKKETQQPAGAGDRSLTAVTITLPAGATLPHTIGADTTIVLTGCNTPYRLDGKTYVKAGGVLQVNAGVTVQGVPKATPAEASALIITKGGKIFATGTATQPITFTSTTGTVGSWGGIVILGRAPINQDSTTTTIEGIDLPSKPADVDVTYGGNRPGDDSGDFFYVRILNAGAAIADANELNSLTLGGVGSGTFIHHVYAARGADDAFECFGGTVGLRFIVAQSTNDDAFDFDFGYRGQIQFALAFVKSADNAFNGDANGIECDNDAAGSNNMPKTRPVISNMTIIGGSSKVAGTFYGSRWRRNTNLTMFNSIIMGYDTAVATQTASWDINTFKYNELQAFGAVEVGPGSLSTSNHQYLSASANGSIALNNPFGAWPASFDARPSASSPAATGANFTEAPINPFGFTVTAYKGAFSPDATTALDWAAFAADETPCN